MGRASRRRQEKIAGVKQEKKVATYNFTEEQFRAEVKKEVTKMKEEVVNNVVGRTVNTYIILTADILHNRFDFGDKRLRRFFHDFYRLCDDLAFDYLEDDGIDIKAIKQALIDDGIDIEDILWNKITDKEVRPKEVDADISAKTMRGVKEKKEALAKVLKDDAKVTNVGETILVTHRGKNYANADAYKFIIDNNYLWGIHSDVAMTVLGHAAEYGVLMNKEGGAEKCSKTL